MSDAELSLQDRLAGILDAGNPFAKVASADPQLEEATAELFEEEVAEAAPEAPEAEAVVEEAPVEEAAEKTASPSLNLNDVLSSDEFKAGFTAVYNDRMDEIEEAVSELF
jgi:hypothetical protein